MGQAGFLSEEFFNWHPGKVGALIWYDAGYGKRF